MDFAPLCRVFTLRRYASKGEQKKLMTTDTCGPALLSQTLARALAVAFIASVENARARLRQPQIGHRTFESPSLAIHRPYTMSEAWKTVEPTAAAAARMGQPGSSRCAPVEHSHLEVVRVPRAFDHNAPVLSAGSLQEDCRPRGATRVRALPFLKDGSGSIFIACPLRIVLFNKLMATATSDIFAIPTNPNPRQSPVLLSVNARAFRAPPAREKCSRRSRLVTELARLPT